MHVYFNVIDTLLAGERTGVPLFQYSIGLQVDSTIKGLFK